MRAWLSPEGRFFNPAPSISVLQLTRDRHCVVIDNALAHPEGLLDWARSSMFVRAHGNAYPGVLVEAAPDMTQLMADYFAQHVRARLGGRRTLSICWRKHSRCRCGAARECATASLPCAQWRACRA